MSDEISIVCHHGNLKRQCPLCEKDTEIERLRAEAADWRRKFETECGVSAEHLAEIERLRFGLLRIHVLFTKVHPIRPLSDQLDVLIAAVEETIQIAATDQEPRP